MENKLDRFGRYSISAFGVANILRAILSPLEDGIDKKKALATCSEITALAGGLKPEHFAWITITRSGERFEDFFQQLSIYANVDETGVSLLYRHIVREIVDEDQRWIDTEYAGEARIGPELDHDIEEVSRWICFASMLLHRPDGVQLLVPEEQRWF